MHMLLTDYEIAEIKRERLSDPWERFRTARGPRSVHFAALASTIAIIAAMMVPGLILTALAWAGVFR